jgi:hypothetical protein
MSDRGDLWYVDTVGLPLIFPSLPVSFGGGRGEKVGAGTKPNVRLRLWLGGVCIKLCKPVSGVVSGAVISRRPFATPPFFPF